MLLVTSVLASSLCESALRLTALVAGVQDTSSDTLVDAGHGAGGEISRATRFLGATDLSVDLSEDLSDNLSITRPVSGRNGEELWADCGLMGLDADCQRRRTKN